MKLFKMGYKFVYNLLKIVNQKGANMSEKRRNTGPTLPRNVDGTFQERHIQYVWLELKERFGFDLKLWKKKFDDYFEKQPRTVSKCEAFYYFGNSQVNNLLNGVLCRNELYPTFNRLVEYVIKKF